MWLVLFCEQLEKNVPTWIFNFLPYSKQFRCAMSFRKGIEDLMLEFRDQFKEYDDRV
jgi:hypothetical protein